MDIRFLSALARAIEVEERDLIGDQVEPLFAGIDDDDLVAALACYEQVDLTDVAPVRQRALAAYQAAGSPQLEMGWTPDANRAAWLAQHGWVTLGPDDRPIWHEPE